MGYSTFFSHADSLSLSLSLSLKHTHAERVRERYTHTHTHTHTPCPAPAARWGSWRLSAEWSASSSQSCEVPTGIRQTGRQTDRQCCGQLTSLLSQRQEDSCGKHKSPYTHSQLSNNYLQPPYLSTSRKDSLSALWCYAVKALTQTVWLTLDV